MPDHLEDNFDESMYDSLTDEQLLEMLRAFEQLDLDFQELISINEDQSMKWEQEVGSGRLLELQSSEENTIKSLDDDDPKIRQLALHLVGHRWKCGLAVSDRCESMAISDPVPEVRGMAISALGLTYRGTDDMRVGAFFAAIVSNLANPLRERKTAYLALLLLASDDSGANLAEISNSFPDSIDNDFLMRYLGNESTSS